VQNKRRRVPFRKAEESLRILFEKGEIMLEETTD